MLLVLLLVPLALPPTIQHATGGPPPLASEVVEGPSPHTPDGGAVSVRGFFDPMDPFGFTTFYEGFEGFLGNGVTPTSSTPRAEPLGLADVHVPPFDTQAWEVTPQGELVFIVRNSKSRLEWRRTDRNLRPLEARVIPGVGLVESRYHLKGLSNLTVEYLGRDRWWISGDSYFPVAPVIYDSAADVTYPMPKSKSGWGGQLVDTGSGQGRPESWIWMVCGDGRGGAVAAVTGPLSAVMAIDANNQLKWKSHVAAFGERSGELRDWRLLDHKNSPFVLLHDQSSGGFVLLDAATGEIIREVDIVRSEGLRRLMYGSTRQVGPGHHLVRWEDDRRGPEPEARVLELETGKLMSVAEAFGEDADQDAWGELRSDGAMWRGPSVHGKLHVRTSERGRLERVDLAGNVLESLGAGERGAFLEVESREPRLLPDGRLVALEDALPELLVRGADGRSLRWERQGLESWASVAADADGALWITSEAGLVEGALGETRGWSSNGEPLGAFHVGSGDSAREVGGRLAFDPRGGKVWSWTVEHAESGVEDLDDDGEQAPDATTTTEVVERAPARLRSFDLEGGLEREHTTFELEGAVHELRALRLLHVDAEGVAHVWLDGDTGSIHVRFTADGTQLSAKAYPTFRPATTNSTQSGSLVIGRVKSPKGLVQGDLVLDIAAPESPRAARRIVGHTAALSRDGLELWAFNAADTGFERRPVEDLYWVDLP